MSKEIILNNLKGSIALENFIQIDKKNAKMKRTLKTAFTIIICSLSITGMAFAKDISKQVYKNIFYTGKGMGTAINEGYIENTEMEYKNSMSSVQNIDTGEEIDAVDTQIKVSEFVMDDYNLSIIFDIELSENIKEIITAEEVWKFNFSDIVIYDENDKILYCPSGIIYNEFCKRNGINSSYDEIKNSEKLINSGLNSIPIQKEGNHIKIAYNLYTGEDKYPKSKKINIDMTQINISRNEGISLGGEEIILTGNWKLEFDVPEKMYNRTQTIFSQKSSTSKDYEVISAVLYDTGMEIKSKVKTEKLPKQPEMLEWNFYKTIKDEIDSNYDNEEIAVYIHWKICQSDEYKEYEAKRFNAYDIYVYLTDENGERYEMTQSARENGKRSIDDDGIMTITAMFDLTKYDNPERVTVHFEYNGQTGEVELKKQ